MNHRIPSKLVYTPCDDSLEGLHTSTNHGIPSRLVYTPCDDSLMGLHHSANHRIPFKLVYTPCGNSLEGSTPLTESYHPLYTSVYRMR